MMRALYTAASGMTAQELNLDNIANNLVELEHGRLSQPATAV